MGGCGPPPPDDSPGQHLATLRLFYAPHHAKTRARYRWHRQTPLHAGHTCAGA